MQIYTNLRFFYLRRLIGIYLKYYIISINTTHKHTSVKLIYAIFENRDYICMCL